MKIKDSPETRRRKWREQYRRSYPDGFKRRRNAEQTAKQRAAQQLYEQRRRQSPLRKHQLLVRKFLNGANNGAEALVGCSRKELVAYLDNLVPPNTLKWKLGYVQQPSEFDLTDPEQCKLCFHFKNLVPQVVQLNRLVSASQCPSTLAPLQANV